MLGCNEPILHHKHGIDDLTRRPPSSTHASVIDLVELTYGLDSPNTWSIAAALTGISCRQVLVGMRIDIFNILCL